jgi:low affinity Fe/Cu permease
MSDTNSLEIVDGGIDQLLNVTAVSINDLGDVNKQLTILSTAVHNFVMQTMQQVNENADTAAVNQVLANALLQVKDFVQSRPIEIQRAKQQLLAKKDAFEQVKLVIGEARSISEKAENNEVEEPLPPDESVEDRAAEKKRELLDQFDENGKYIKRLRKIGERPESLKTIRNIETELASRKNLEEDI